MLTLLIAKVRDFYL